MGSPGSSAGGYGSVGEGGGQLVLAPSLDASMDPLLRTMQQSRLRQAKKLQQLQRQTELDAERHAAALHKLLQLEQRRQELDTQRHEAAVAKAQQASAAEVSAVLPWQSELAWAPLVHAP